jgi:predicted ribosomally synthesized peptide with nif11-like leader
VAITLSQEKAQEFIRRVGTDRDSLRLPDNLESKDDLLRVAQAFGYEFTATELELAIVRIMDLQEWELESVTGGLREFGYGELLSIVNLLGLKNVG